MFNKKRYIPKEDLIIVDGLVEFILDNGTTDHDIITVSKDLEEIPGRIWMALGMLSIRLGLNYKKAFDRFIGIKKKARYPGK